MVDLTTLKAKFLQDWTQGIVPSIACLSKTVKCLTQSKNRVLVSLREMGNLTAVDFLLQVRIEEGSFDVKCVKEPPV